MSKCIIGIDPGASGALCVITSDTFQRKPRQLVQIIRLDNPDVYDFVNNLSISKPKAFIEFIDRRKRWGKSGIAQMRSISENYGYWCGFLKGVGISYETVESNIFSSVCGCKLKIYNYACQKEANWQAAKRLYPDMIIQKDAADAVLIAHYGSLRT